MKLLALMGSPREGGNTDMLVDEAVEAAAEAGADVEKIDLHQTLAGEMCNGCLDCTTAARCVVDPNTDAVLDKIKAADAVLTARTSSRTPVTAWTYYPSLRSASQPEGKDGQLSSLDTTTRWKYVGPTPRGS